MNRRITHSVLRAGFINTFLIDLGDCFIISKLIINLFCSLPGLTKVVGGLKILPQFEKASKGFKAFSPKGFCGLRKGFI